MKKLLILLSLLILTGAYTALAGNYSLMSKEELKAELSSDNLVILDVRSGRDWSSSEFKIKGAVRTPGEKIAEWAPNYTKDTPLVLYCA